MLDQAGRSNHFIGGGKIPQTFEWQNFEVSLAIIEEFFHRILTVLLDFDSKS
jgi:hypothetical protein